MLREDLRLKLTELQKKIDARGILDIKWTFSQDANDVNKVAEDMIHLLEAFFDGRMKPLPPIGDSNCRCDKFSVVHQVRDHDATPEEICKRGLEAYEKHADALHRTLRDCENEW